MSAAVNYNDILAAYSAYAPAIRPFLLYADTLDEIRSKLTKTTRLAFLDLVARTNIANPDKPIMVRVDRTAKKLGISEKSVSRTIGLMRKNGWLEVSKGHDGRNNNGEFAWKEYIVTSAFRALLRMSNTVVHEPDSARPAPLHKPAKASFDTSPAPTADNGATEILQVPAENFDSVRKALDIVQRRAAQQTKLSREKNTQVDGHPESIQQPSDNSDLCTPPDAIGDILYTANPRIQTELSDGPIYAVNNIFIKKEASFQKEALKREAFSEKAVQESKPEESKTIHIPKELQEMQHALDILPAGICSLMGLAKRTGQRLQDVWKAKKEVLLNSGAKNGRAVKYLRFLLNCGEDFSYVARTKVDVPKPPAGVQHQSSDSQTQTDSHAPHNSKDSQKRCNGMIGAELIAIAKACRYKRFQHISNSVMVRIFDGTAEVVAGARNAILGGWEQMQQLYLDIARGNLVEIPE